MGLLAELRARALGLTKDLSGEVADSGHAAVYLRQLLRGNRGDRAHLSQHAPTAALDEDGKPVAGALWPPVLVIHGYLATRGSLHLLERQLSRRGHVVLS